MVVADINLDGASAVAAESKSVATNPKFVGAEAVHVDVADEDSVQRAVAKTIELFGRIDYCVNAAGVGSNPRRIYFSS